MNFNTKYVLHQHDAKKAGTHWDLRIQFEPGGKLASWSIPRAKDPRGNEKLLAIKTQDHNKFFLRFKGPLGKGYGEGYMSILQSGEMFVEYWTDSMVIFEVKGKYLNGRYSLVKTKQQLQNKKSSKQQETWLFIKSKKKITKENTDNLKYFNFAMAHLPINQE